MLPERSGLNIYSKGEFSETEARMDRQSMILCFLFGLVFKKRQDSCIWHGKAVSESQPSLRL